MKHKKKTVYATGGKVNYVEDPYTELQQDNINKVKAESQANSNPLLMGMDMLGRLTQQVGGSLTPGENDKVSANQVNQVGGGIEALTSFFAALGGTVPNGNVEAEGEEVVETPDGQVAELKGPKHEQGGIELFLPPGTEIFSERLKGPDGMSMADRKMKREKKAKKIEKLFSKSPSDMTLKKTMEKVLKGNEKQEQADLAKMEEARMQYNTGMKMMMGGMMEYAMGGKIPWYQGSGGTRGEYEKSEDLMPKQEEEFDFGEILKGITFGDGVGMAGNLLSTFGPMANTQANRAGDTPNQNFYENYGEDGLAKLDESKQYVEGQRDNALQDIQLTTNAARKRGRNSARGVNTMRALDLANTIGANQTEADIYDNFTRQMMGIFRQEAQYENLQDQQVMRGEEARDLADRRDRDAYFTQLAQDISTKGAGLRKIGKDVNQIKSRNVTGNVMKELFPNYSIDAMTGKTNFNAEDVMANATNYARITKESDRKKVYDKVSSGEFMWKGNKLFNKAGKEIDLATLKPKK